MENKKLALASACMTMFASEPKGENESRSEKDISEFNKLKKEIAENFPFLFEPISELYNHDRKEEQKEKIHFL